MSSIEEAARKEQAAYRAGWKAGLRGRDAGHSSDAIAYSAAHLNSLNGLYDDSAHLRAEASRVAPRDFDRPQLMAVDPKPIDIARIAHEYRVDADRAASKAHAEREYWADGIDPDEP